MPYFGITPGIAPTILGLEADVRYQAFFWEPSKGIKVVLGLVARTAPGAARFHVSYSASRSSSWSSHGAMADSKGGALIASGETLMTLKKIKPQNVGPLVQAKSAAYA